MQEVTTMFLRTLGKVRKMEMFTKLDGVKSFKLVILILYFEEEKKHEALRNSIFEGSIFFFSQYLNKSL